LLTGVYARMRPRKDDMTQQTTETKPKPKKIEITIDEQPYIVEEKEMTVREILALVGKDTDSYYLVEVKGKKERDKYENPDELIRLHKGSTFVAVFRGETPVS
jgi:hypothetical protein